MFRKYVNNTVLLNVTYEQRRWYYYHTLTLCLTPVTTKITNTTIFRATQRCYQYRITPSNLKWRVSQCYVSSVAASGVFDTSTNISLDTWYKYVDQIPIHEILPIGLRTSIPTEIITTTAVSSDNINGDEATHTTINGNIHSYTTVGSDIVNYNAFFGDKRMNMEISKILRYYPLQASSSKISNDQNHNNTDQMNMIPSVGIVTTLQSYAMSNQILYQYLPEILPNHITSNMMLYIQEQNQIHDAGTIVEAAVHAVAMMKDTHPDANHNQDDAIIQLAQFLVQKAILFQQQQHDNTITKARGKGNTESTIDNKTSDDDTTVSTSTTMTNTNIDMINPKGQLLQIGGRVISKRLSGYPDHAPQFTATAYYQYMTTTMNYGRNKREAEQAAASMIWRYYIITILPKKLLQEQNITTTTATTDSNNNDENSHNNVKTTGTRDVDGDVENPKGRILSIGGKVTCEKLPNYPDHLPRYKATCTKEFFVSRPKQIEEYMYHNNDTDNDDNDNEQQPQKSSYIIEATAEGRTKYEAERIASTIVWRYVMNMSTTPTSNNTNPMLPLISDDDNDDVNDDNDENNNTDDIDDADIHLTAKERRRIRNLKKLEKRQLNKFEVRDTQNNFLLYKLEDQPMINLRPGGETVVESWYRGALHPNAAFHRALIAPHVFPQLIGTVNAWTRKNVSFYDAPDDNLHNNEDSHNHNTVDSSTMRDNVTLHDVLHDNVDNNEDSTNQANVDSSITYVPDLENQSIPGSQDQSLLDVSNNNNADHYRELTSNVGETSLHSDSDITSQRSGTFDLNTDDTIIDTKSSDESTLNITNITNSDTEHNPLGPLTVSTHFRRQQMVHRSYSVIAVVVPHREHPLIQPLDPKEYNNSELMTKCFVGHGKTPREARIQVGLSVNQYIIDVLLKETHMSYDTITQRKDDDTMESVTSRKKEKVVKLTKKDRKNIFFSF